MNSSTYPSRSTPEPIALRVLSLLTVLGLIGIPSALVAWHHLRSPNLWFDESGQYWLAQGLHHFSPPNSQPGGWARIVEYGRVFNSDPGSFTLLLRGWTKVLGNSPVVLRSLPFLFFLLTPTVIFFAARRIGTNSLVASLAASAPLGFAILLHYATEIRAYSMESCGVTWFFFLSCWLRKETRWSRVIWMGIVAALLVTSRYSAFFYGAAACLTTLMPMRPLGAAVRRVLCFSIPCAMAAAAGFLIFARYQAGGTQRPPAYVEAFMLKGKTSAVMLAQFHDNFLSKEGLPIACFLILAPIFVWFGPRALSRLRTVVGRAAMFSLFAVTFAIVASLTGKLPWEIHTRWSIGYQALSACCLAMSVIAIGNCLALWATSLPWKALAAVATCGSVGVWAVRIEHTIHTERPYYETIASHLAKLAQSPAAKDIRFFVQSGASPTVRYLCEVGPLRGTDRYPENFHFETGAEEKGAKPIAAEDYDVVILTHFNISDGYLHRVVGGTVNIQLAPQPSCLLVLTK